MLRLKHAARAALLLAVAGCTADLTAPQGPDGAGAALTIADAAHSGAVPGFYFLPPMVPSAAYAGTFDAALQPRVEICELAGPVCGPVVASFPFGTGSSSVRVDAAGQHYIANWNTPKSLDPNKFYRIQVFVGTVQLGYADVDVVRTGKEKNAVDATQFVALMSGQSLAIKFRIETGIAAQVVVSPDSASVVPGATQQFTAAVTDLHGNPLPGAPVTWSSGDPSVATVDASGLATGVATGSTTITATSGGASDSAVLTVFNPNTPPVAQPDTFEAIGNVTVPVPAPGVLANDTDPEADALSVVAGTYPTASGGTVTLAADGSFSYLSAAGFTGQDSFTYTVTDGGATASATVTVVSGSRVWYVSNAAPAPGDGRDASPFATLAQAEAASAPGETIFVHFGNGTPAGYDAGITLKSGQSLTGQGITAPVGALLNGVTVTLLSPGGTPTLTRAGAGATLSLGVGNTVQGLAVQSTGGPGIEGDGFGTFAAAHVSVAAVGGPALRLDGGTVAASFSSLSSTGSATDGMLLRNLSGTLDAPAGAVTGAAGAGVHVDGGAGTIGYGGSVTAGSGRSILVVNRTGGSVTLSGDVTDGAQGVRIADNSGGTIALTGASKAISTGANTGVELQSNAGATIQFAGGGLAVSTSGATAFSATGGGTLTVTGAGNTLSAANAAALSVVNTTIGVAGLSFQSISASNAADGVVLENTGATNGLQVTGTGAPASGGTLSGMSGSGVRLEDARNVFLSYMAIQNTGGSGVRGTGVTNFSFQNGSVTAAGTALGIDASSIAFNSAAATNLSGTLSITGSTLANAYYHGVHVVNRAGTLTQVSITGNTITSSASTVDSRGSGIVLLAQGSAGAVARVLEAQISGNAVTGFPSGSGIHAVGGNATAGGPAGSFGVAGDASQAIAITGNRIQGASAGARMAFSAIVANVTGSGTGNFVISGNGTLSQPLAHMAGTAISHTVQGPATVTSSITGNVVAPGNINASQGIGVGADQLFGAADSPSLTTTISGNRVSQTDGVGIYALARASAAHLNATITGNTVAAPLAGVRPGIRVDSGSGAGNVAVCLAISGNTSAGAGGFAGIGLRKQGVNPAVNAFGVVGMAATATPGVEAYVAGQNPSGGGAQLISAASGFSNCSL